MTGMHNGDDQQERWDAWHRAVERDGLDQPHRFDISSTREWLFESTDNAPTPRAEEPPAPQQATAGSAHTAQPAANKRRSLVRPYARTGGRTRADYDLAIETLISTTDQGRSYRGAAVTEHRSICELCDRPRSVAEVAAHLALPLGVAKVLLADMANIGLVQVHESGVLVGDGPSLEFMERVLSGLRAL
ncbi:uncharacterized protein DUF742 [Tamaricihabitans halophyticus]|uniref:Uncharacterized protein DUF742 n=1 Tax=Tamaricihabitans halophyticus TaxID=1262583 RepID=A0A4R2R1K8_9PSEU|nr:DUF742 domain-containing protein [Tamaricihabitans halophyticus]TCP56580.1 uncharacterized protein DUF742 [Tamaricihabitans halophyticus]